MERILRVCQLIAIISFIVNGIRCEELPAPAHPPIDQKDLDDLIKDIFQIPNDQTSPPSEPHQPPLTEPSAPHPVDVTPAQTQPPSPPPTPSPKPQYPTHVTQPNPPIPAPTEIVPHSNAENEPNVSGIKHMLK